MSLCVFFLDIMLDLFFSLFLNQVWRISYSLAGEISWIMSVNTNIFWFISFHLTLYYFLCIFSSLICYCMDELFLILFSVNCFLSINSTSILNFKHAYSFKENLSEYDAFLLISIVSLFSRSVLHCFWMSLVGQNYFCCQIQQLDQV